MSDLKDLLNKALPAERESPEYSADTAIRRGTRIRRRRRAATATAAALGCLLVLALGAFTVVTVWPRQSPPAADPEPTVELPTLESDEYYYWIPLTDAYDDDPELTEPYSAALDDFLESGESQLLATRHADGFGRFGRELFRDNAGDFLDGTDKDAADDRVHQQPYYHAVFDSASGDSVYVDVIPSGGFAPGSTTELKWEGEGGDYMGPGDAATHLIACGEHDEGDGAETVGTVSVDCDETTGPDGRIIRGLETHAADESRYADRVVLYRDDGTAVSVRYDGADNKDDSPQRWKAMTDLASSLPTDPVR